MSYIKGSEWRKWDLHVHTPNSMVNYYTGTSPEEKWEKFITDLEALPPEFKVLGINDYLFIDGYEKVLEYKKNGRLKNIDSIFPVIEFRIKKFGGNKVFKRVNFHIIFSNTLSVEIIKQQFLNQLYGSYKLADGLEGVQWGGFITPDSLRDFGKAIKNSLPADRIDQFGDDLEEGFNNINFDEQEILQTLNKSTSYLKGKYLTAIGKTEWDEFSWVDNSIGEKKTVINSVDFVFTSSENIDSFNKAKKKLVEQNVNSLLLDCSDAHRNSNSTNKDRIGKCFTWIKSDPTFEGLKQVLNEPDRLSVTGTPELLERIASNANKFIEGISIKRVDGSSMPEIWYDNLSIPLNPSLVAIIGNKGNGKSALTDIIGLVGNSYNDSYSFLTKNKFRKQRPYNKSANIEAKLIWLDKTEDGYCRLDGSINPNKIEKVKYIPQNFLETLCVSEDELEFETEIKKIIFSHTENSERLGFSNLDELINYKSEIVNKDLGSIKGEIDDLNKRIILLERKTIPSFKASLTENLSAKESEYSSHQALVPKQVTEPKNDPSNDERNNKINTEIATLRNSVALKIARQKELNQQKSSLLLATSELEKSRQAFQTIENSLETIKEVQKEVLSGFDIDINQVLQYKIDLSPIVELVNKKNTEIDAVNFELNSQGIVKESIANDIISLNSQIKILEEKLDEPFRLYQKYLKDLDEWRFKQKSLVGEKSIVGSIEYFKDQIDYVENRLPSELEIEFQKRKELIKKLFYKKCEINELYSNSYKPISDFISTYGHLMKDYKINVSVEFTIDSFIQKFFDHISQGAKGTFIGVEEGNKILSELISNYDLNDVDSLLDFLDELRNSLHSDKRQGERDVHRDVSQQMKKGYDIEDLYRFIYDLDYLKPTFRLNLGTKNLAELSPGERGALLLIFYLFLDKDDKPLIIDQPEENLDNQSVYNYLVHFIKEAKKRRQIIIVTHNPNLAVVCDAEQIIHMSIDKAGNNKVSFISGSIENNSINETIVNILEGTKPAFSNRTNKYSLATN